MKYEIEIEGIPEGFEPVKATYIGASLGKTETATLMVELRRKVRKYDWSKTLDDVLTTIKGYPAYFPAAGNYEPAGIAEIWQPNIHGKCPVDPEASIVRLKRIDGSEEEIIASAVNWQQYRGASWTVLSWKFVRLADGVEW